MNAITLQPLLRSTLLNGALLMTATVARGVPVSGEFAEDARGDLIAHQLLSHELGDMNLFPGTDVIAYHAHRHHFPVGVPEDGIANDWTVHMTNVSGRAWKDLFFVADHGATIGNADGRVQDLLGAPGVMTDAFRIDALGSNPNLLFESISQDGIFQPFEEWEFAVTNFGTGFNSVPPALISPGHFAGSSQISGFTGTNASIVGTAAAVPEPSTGILVIIAAIAGLMQRRERV